MTQDNTREALSANLAEQARKAGGDPIEIWIDKTDLQLVLAALSAPAPQVLPAEVEYTLWVLAEHNALHFGENHNTVILARAALSSQSPAPSPAAGAPESDNLASAQKAPYFFRRFVRGQERAEDVMVEHADSLDEAMKTAARICPSRALTVLVLAPECRRSAETDAEGVRNVA